jgi:hypothetical protein
VAAGIVALVAVGGTLAAVLGGSSGPAPLHAKVTVAILGADCDQDGYSDMSQVVVKTPAGREVAYADLKTAKDDDAFCEYTGSITIPASSSYFLVNSRSQTRPALRFSQSEIKKKGINLTIGDCSDADYDEYGCLKSAARLASSLPGNS